jgi:hypothetical protein
MPLLQHQRHHLGYQDGAGDGSDDVGGHGRSLISKSLVCRRWRTFCSASAVAATHTSRANNIELMISTNSTTVPQSPDGAVETPFVAGRTRCARKEHERTGYGLGMPTRSRCASRRAQQEKSRRANHRRIAARLHAGQRPVWTPSPTAAVLFSNARRAAARAPAVMRRSSTTARTVRAAAIHCYRPTCGCGMPLATCTILRKLVPTSSLPVKIRLNAAACDSFCRRLMDAYFKSNTK